MIFDDYNDGNVTNILHVVAAVMSDTMWLCQCVSYESFLVINKTFHDYYAAVLLLLELLLFSTRFSKFTAQQLVFWRPASTCAVTDGWYVAVVVDMPGFVTMCGLYVEIV